MIQYKRKNTNEKKYLTQYEHNHHHKATTKNKRKKNINTIIGNKNFQAMP